MYDPFLLSCSRIWPISRRSLRLLPAFALGVAVLSPSIARAQAQSAKEFVQAVVTSELAADASDHSRWMYLDANKVPDSDTVKLVVQTAEGDISETIWEDGRTLTAEERQQDRARIHQFVTDASVRQKQAADAKHDSEQAAALTRMLPGAFLWTETGRSGGDVTLSFRPDPKFQPPTREARVFAAMAGTMVVDRQQRSIKSLKGRLTQDVDFGWGLLGKLEKGGTFSVERQQIAPGIWEITATHVHIQGHALIFKSIGEQQDEVTSHYKRAPASISPARAATMLENGTVARSIGVKMPE